MLGWIILAGLLAIGIFMFFQLKKPTVTEERRSSLSNIAGPNALDPALNRGVPLPGAGDNRSPQGVFRNWAEAVHCLPIGQTLNDQFDLDIGKWEHGKDTSETGEHDQIGSVWFPSYGRLKIRVENKMLDEVGSGWPANPPDADDNSQRSLRMDFRSCVWRALVRELQRTGEQHDPNQGFSDWRRAMRAAGKPRGDDAKRALRASLSVARSAGT